MVISRKDIISKAESAQLIKEQPEIKQQQINQNELEDCWFDKNTLYKDHINEVLQKWKSIDDEIWSKVVIFQRNQRVAKAYLRSPLVNINSSQIGFDGNKVGLNAFKACFHDDKVNLIKNRIGKGIDLLIEENGNISIRKVNVKCEIIVRPFDNKSNAIPDQLLLNNGRLMNNDNINKVIFDLNKFKCNIFKELNNGKVDRRSLENQCICTVIFIRESSTNELFHPIWLLFINIVALDFLRSKYIDLLLNVNQPINRQQLLNKDILRKELDKESIDKELIKRSSDLKSTNQISKQTVTNDKIKDIKRNSIDNSTASSSNSSTANNSQTTSQSNSPTNCSINSQLKNQNKNQIINQTKIANHSNKLTNKCQPLPPHLDSIKQTNCVNLTKTNLNIKRADVKQSTEQNDLQLNKCSSKSSSNLKYDSKQQFNHKSSNSVTNIMAMFNKSNTNNDLKMETKLIKQDSSSDSIKSSTKSKANLLIKSANKLLSTQLKESNDKETKKSNKKLINKNVVKDSKDTKISKEIATKESIIEKQSMDDTNLNEDEILVSNKTKLIEKKLIDEMKNQPSHDRISNLVNKNLPSSTNSSNNVTKSKLNAYRNGYINRYFENNTQKNFHKLLYNHQNSFDSGFYSPSSNDSYNLSSTSGSCNALIYSTSGSEQNTLNTTKDCRTDFTNNINRKDFRLNKELIFLDPIDSIDPLPTSFNSRLLARKNLIGPCFNGTSSYWNNYRKYYSTEILSDWN